MRSQTLIKKYTQGLINSIDNEKEFLVVRGQLSEFESILESQEKLKIILLSPFLAPLKKINIVKEVLKKKSFKKKTIRFIDLILENDRLGVYSVILENLTEAWNEKKGILTFEVTSVVPLTENQKKKLRRKLESLEKKSVFLNYKIDSGLLGGLRIKRKNVVYDVSIEGNLSRLKEKICEGKA
jgi:F-type H+-transporting ATPase subunit delta